MHLLNLIKLFHAQLCQMESSINLQKRRVGAAILLLVLLHLDHEDLVYGHWALLNEQAITKAQPGEEW